MDGEIPTISPEELYSLRGTAASPLVVDVRPAEAFDTADWLIAGAIRQNPEYLTRWATASPSGRRAVFYCSHGHEISQGVVSTFINTGVQAAYLSEGADGWRERHFPTRRKTETVTDKWVTREHPKIDRIACPWLIRRFIDPNAMFLYVPAAEVLTAAERTGAIPFDIDGVEYTHEGDRCSFDTILRKFGLEDYALDHLAMIVRGADTSRHELAPQCGGLFAISLGLSANFPNDRDMLGHGLVVYDALFTWCRSLQAETHNWPVKAATAA
jgi:rhodanese-related sulfurtransferase